jgi:SAM-dependent methyltransferase
MRGVGNPACSRHVRGEVRQSTHRATHGGDQVPAVRRSALQKVIDTVTLPLRVFTLFEDDRWGLSSLATERYDYVAREVMGYCLDVGCGRHNRFVTRFLGGIGVGIDVFPYEGLSTTHIVEDMRHFPFADGSFDTVTFIANLNHIPRSLRDRELREAYRCLKSGGNIIVTMGNPFIEIVGHQLVRFYDRWLGTCVDMDSERGMCEEEDYYVPAREVRERLRQAGFADVKRRRFATQWGLNALFVGWKW